MLVELLETIRQTQPNYLFLAVSNNLYKDDLLDNILDEKDFCVFKLPKELGTTTFKNKTINAYLQVHLMDDFSLNLSEYKCLG